MKWPVILAAMALAGCAENLREKPINTQAVSVPVAAPCVPKDKDPGPAPAYADENLPTAPDQADERYRRIAAANAQRKARLAVVEPIVTACR